MNLTTDMFCWACKVLVQHKIWTSISFSAKTGWDRVEFHLMDKEGGLQFSSSLTTLYCLPNNKAKCGLSYHCDCAIVFLIPAPSFTSDTSQAVVFYDDRLT